MKSTDDVHKRTKACRGTNLAAPPFDLVVGDAVADDGSKKGGGHAPTNGPTGVPSSMSMSPAPVLSSSSSPPSFDETLGGVAGLLRGRRNVVVLVGAGMSTSCGIPDFRGRESGLYNTLDAAALGLSCPEELFCLDFFRDDPAPFFQFAKNLYFPLGLDRRVEPSDSHRLLAMLEKKKMLLRVYSQNIDGLEAVAGVSSKKIVYAHGSLRWAKCLKCSRKVTCDDIMPAIAAGTVPRCRAPPRNSRGLSCSLSSPGRGNGVGASRNQLGGPGSSSSSAASPRAPSQRNRKRPRAASSDGGLPTETGGDGTATNDDGDNNDDGRSLYCDGVYKPGVTFFGEALNDNVRRALEADRDKVDALVVIGTSLSVAPISKVVEYLPPHIPRILINRTVVHPATRSTVEDAAVGGGNDDEEETEFRDNYVFDAYLLGFCDDVTRALARQLFRGENETVSVHGNGGSKSENTKKKNRRTTARPNHASPRVGVGPHSQFGATLVRVLEGKEENWKADEWSCLTVPASRVLLFPGALASNDDTTSEAKFREIAHCDGCSRRIRGVLQKCAVCFDYDLCAKCFPVLSKTHYEGKHTFCAEKAAL